MVTRKSTTRFGRAACTFAVSIGAIAATVAAAPAVGASAPPIYVDGSRIAVPAIERRGRVFVPIRGVFERLGAAVTYTPPSAVVARKSGTDIVRLTLGERAATVSGRAALLEAAPFRSQGRTFVPLRLISESAGAIVAYDSAPRRVRITDGSPTAAVAVPAERDRAPVSAPAERHGIPWWLWLLLLLALLLLLLLFMRRRKREPVIVTRSSPHDPDLRR